MVTDTFDGFLDGLQRYLSGDVDLSITGKPEAVEAVAALLTAQLGLDIVGAVVFAPQNVSPGRLRLKGTLVVPPDLVKKRAKSDNKQKSRT